MRGREGDEGREVDMYMYKDEKEEEKMIQQKKDKKQKEVEENKQGTGGREGKWWGGVRVWIFQSSTPLSPQVLLPLSLLGSSSPLPPRFFSPPSVLSSPWLMKLNKIFIRL